MVVKFQTREIMIGTDCKSQPFLLVGTFSEVWSAHYGGEVYEMSGKDLKYAREYLEINGGNFVPDNIVGKAKVYLKRDGVYAENRHSFTAFIRNIGTFVEQKSRPVREKRTMRFCDCCEASYYEEVGHRCVTMGEAKK